MRSIKKIHLATYSLIADLKTYTPLPTTTLRQIDPFIFLNHHGPQVYPPNNQGLPFGPHPHRGMETVTFVIEGDIVHKDSAGHASIIEAGGVQWMTAGKGLIHAEVSSDKFRQVGGPLEILQLWLNLPSRLKMTEPSYAGKQGDEIPKTRLDNDAITFQVISGQWDGVRGAFTSKTGVSLSLIYMESGAKLKTSVPADHNILFYIIRGKMNINGRDAAALQLVEFANDDESLRVQASSSSIVLFGHAKPIGEPVVAQGPFVMNTEEEIMQAYEDYRLGKFGTWKG